VLFVGITWAVTAGFELLLYTGSGLLLFGLRHGWVPEEWIGPGATGSTPAVACTPPASTAGPPPGASDPKVTAIAAWQLGDRLGFLASARDAETGATAAVEAETTSIAAMARSLGVPVPLLGALAPRSERPAVFARSMQSDQWCIVGTLAQRYSPRHGALFRFGAFAGYIRLMRAALPGGAPLFVPELRYHAVRAGVPEALWQPFVADMTGMSPEQAGASMAAARLAIDRHLLGIVPAGGAR
jgi:hypothetical protein